MEECEISDTEITKLTEFQGEASDVISQDDEDEVEELQNSLREVIQDHSVKPKLQCLMVDPSFSMVTVQSEDSGIVWETASSRCSTPWASETSSISEACNMEGSGSAGKITIIFDEDKVVRRRTRSGRSSRLRDRLTRTGTSRSASALGVERPEMAEVSLPNVKEHRNGAETDLEEIRNRDQQLFSLISEGYEILNIRVPSKLPTVDEEESTELQDNLTYLDETPKIRSRSHLNKTTQNNSPSEEVKIQESIEQQSTNEDTLSSLDTELKHTSIPQDGSKDIDYFEKFTLVDEVVPGQKSPELKEQVEEPLLECTVESMPAKVDKDNPSESEDSFVMVTEVEIVGEHLDEVFYGEGAPANAMQQKVDEEVKGSRVRRDSQRSMKESGSVLFGSEETTLTPIYISPGPPKIIDPILLEEPTAMSFMYSDLYEDAVGEKRKSDEEYSEVESVASEKSFKKCFSDSEEAEGYLEKFILKDDTPTVDIPVDAVEDKGDRRLIWSQSKFEMTGCLTRAVEEEQDKDKAEDSKQVVNTEVVKDSDAPKSKEHGPEKAGKEVHHSEDSEEQLAHRDLIHEDSLKKEEGQATDQIPDSKIVTVETTYEHQRNDHVNDQSQSKTQEKPQTHAVPEQKPDISPTVTDLLQSEDTVGDTYETEVVIDKDILEEILAEGADRNMEALKVTLEEKYKKMELDPKEPAVEGFTDCEPMVHAVVKITEKTADENLTQTKVQIDLQEVTSTPQKETLTQNVSVPESVCFAPDTELEVITKMDEQEADSSNTQQEMNAHEYQIPSKDNKADTLKTERDDDLIVLVPKGQAVEMDIDMSPSSERITKCETVNLLDPDTEYEQITKSDHHTIETLAVPQPEEPIGKSEYLNSTPSPTPSLEKAGKDELEAKEDKDDLFSPLRSFAPQEDLSLTQEENLQSDAAGKEENGEVAIEREMSPETDFYIESEGKTKAQDEISEDIPELTFEIITELDTSEQTELGGWEDVQEPVLVSVQEVEEERDVKDFQDEELIEADYDIIDAEEQLHARLAAELQGMDWFCLTCQSLLSKEDCDSGDHDGHEVTAVDKAFEDVKERLSDWISELQGRSENIEDLVSELELAYHSVEHQCVESEAAMQAQNDEMMALVMQQYNDMSVNMEEEKKAKLEQLYDQIVSFQESIDSAKATLETTAREADAEARTPDDIHARLKAALESTMSLELGSKGLLVFEDYAKGNASSPQLAQRKGIPVPQRPILEPQEAGLATSTSVTVYWRVNPGDIIDCFQVYCMEDPQGAVSEEYRVTVKESYCNLEELEPDKSYKVWVMAVNYTGCSLPSERRVFTTAPSVPVIDSERCTVTWDSAKLRWSPATQNPGQSFILEYCRQYELEGDGLRSIAGIKSCEHGVLLQPNENYLFYVKAVNEAGVSEQSEAALISTKGTRFHLLKASAHPALELSEDQTSVSLSKDVYEHVSSTEKQPPFILGELLPARGHHYWETTVSECPAYRLGVAHISAQRKCFLGENKLSWCLQCIPSPSGCRYQMIHGATQSSMFVIESPERVGTLLDYQLGRLCFYNAQTGQALGSFRHSLTGPCHPVLALETPGRLEVGFVPELPEFVRGC
ncbi:cardiomyopathy-associated protein 5 [Corythoichthys intestinalis]|uniref:cardiomyopathy-associated protein 5 n=1 Tax=Corythoichthys intestinalis TaxID=161448 RepID=UPI0025A5580F|nr:cardiomyopathy-associated protein 5 [Corythoichthys intestinalis]